MCDEHTLKDDEKYLRGRGVSRRGFGALAGGAALAATLARPAFAVDVTESEVSIETPDGVCDAHFVHPVSGPAPAVLVWPDIMGLRPTFRAMGTRLAESGYAVLTVNSFYRSQPAPVVAEGESFADPDVRPRLFAMRGLMDDQTDMSDARAFIAWLDGQDAVDTSRGVGTTGYCMGGPQIMRTAAAVPGRVRAAASFHGGGLATGNPDSPHLLIPQMQASLLIAVAENDDEQDPQAKVTLREAFDAAGVSAEIEVYEGALHGWCVPDSAVYHEAQAERAWSRLLALFEGALA